MNVEKRSSFEQREELKLPIIIQLDIIGDGLRHSKQTHGKCSNNSLELIED